jgi:hypothetical protein
MNMTFNKALKLLYNKAKSYASLLNLAMSLNEIVTIWIFKYFGHPTPFICLQ